MAFLWKLLPGQILLSLLILTEFAEAQQSPTSASASPVLPYISFGTTNGVETEYVGHFDDGVSHAIHIPNGFPFGTFLHSSVYIGTNGIFSFSSPFYSAVATAFPSSLSTVANAYLVAPYWDDVDIRLAGNISYEVHSRSNNNLGSNQLLNQISQFVEDSTGDSFQGDWMLVAEWEEVHPWPHGLHLSNPIWELFFPELVLNNTWQGLVITDGATSYAVFTYRCGDMNWAFGPTIGFNAAGDYYVNHPNTGSRNGEEIACLNSPTSEWYNLVYEISSPNATNQTAELPTVEPPQGRYLSFLEFTNATATSGTLPPCQNCTVAITIPSGFPFGSYYHPTLYVGTNGIFSFGRDFRQDIPEAFPSTDAEIYFAYLVAPYWSNIDTRLDGQVNYEVYVMGESAISNDYLGRVLSLINSEQDPDFTGNWMIVVTWDGVHPFPHGNSAEQDRVDPYLQSANTFQGILITNGTKSYSVFTYECDQMEWSDEATIGYNAGGEYNASHPLSGTLFANAIDCLHINVNETVNNIIYDLVPGELNAGTTPPPPSSLGSCVAAGYSDCCEAGSCVGHLLDCFCDEFCYNFDDCCSDISDVCSIEAPLGNDTYLLFGTGELLSRVGLIGNDLHVLVHQPSTIVLGVDFDHQRDYLYWSVGIADVIYRSKMDGSNIEVLLNTSIEVVDDIAMDWIGNNLYWTDAVHARIEVMDMDTRYRMELMRTGANTIPRAIAVDPSTRWMFWTDWGDEARIERSSMDGSDRRVLHNTGLTWPNGLTIDYPAQRIYWVDAFRDMIEYSNVDGSGRFLLLSNLDHPFSITLEGNLLFWSDWFTNAIHATHKISSTGATFVYNNLRDRPFGIEAVTPSRQAQNITNPCDGTSCTFMCLLSSTDPNGYSCACPDGYELASDSSGCTFVGTLPPPTTVGSCIDAGYQNCCIAGYCAGSPPTCSCDLTCYLRGDCCPDANMTCPRGSCAAAGYRACCTDGGTCRGSAGCFCDYACTFFGDCCYDFEDLCPTDVGTVVGSCSAAGYTTCCDDGSECLGTPANCKCDAECRDHGDCCADIGSTCPLLPSGNFTVQMTWLPFLTLRSTPGVVTNLVPAVDDGSSPAIPIPSGFPIGNSNQSVAYIGTNGVISFQQPFTYHIPSLFPSSLSFVSSAYLLAPFWSDVDITIYGSIFYEVHSDSDSLLIQQVNNFISNQTETDFRGTWMLVVQWDEVREFPGFLTIPTNTYQAMAITDGSQSYAVYTYRCGDLQWPGGATIGYNGGPVGNFYQNHPLSGNFANSIACINTGVTEWSNVIYNVSIDTYIFTGQPPTNESGLPYVSLGTTDGVEREYVGHFDDGVSHAIHIPDGFPFGNFIHSSVYVGTNGIFSFFEPFYSAAAVAFPSTRSTVANAYLVAPYWDDVDIRLAGNISYEVHSRSNNNLGSNQLLNQISQFIEDSTGDSFQGDWMLVAEWEEVHPWPHGLHLSNPIWELFFPELVLNNTWQGLVITDGVTSYAVFTYRCGDMNWAYGPTIGFNAAGDNYINHPNTGSTNGEEIACLNSPTSQWYNLVYEISLPNATDLTAQLPTVEPPQSRYLSFLEFTNNTATSGTLPPCQNCTIPITIPGNGFPFGSYYHSTVYIGTNGIFSFGRDFRQDTPEAFPSTDAEIYYAYLVAPYWSNIDTRLDGQVNYEVHVMGESATSNDYLGRVSSLINSEQDPDFTGNWMIVVTWDGVHPFPHGNSAEQDRVDPYLQSANTFQGILITNGTKSYSVFTYECDQMEWSDEATIGYNAGGEYNASHPLSGTLFANAIDCLHININETINNIIYDLVPGELNVGTTPPPPSSLGSCIAAGYSDCCEDGICFGHISDCFCDEFCYNFDDCCSDITDICSIEAPLGNDTYLVFGSVQLLSRVGLNGSDLHVLVHQPNTAVLGVDFDYRRGYLYWSEGIGDVMYRSNMDGSNIEALLNTSIDVVDDIAMDWIGNNLYWTDAVHARIEVMDMDTSYRMELMRTGANTIPRAIAVDPSTRFMYWTDWGDEARIERASMDGSDRRVLHNTGLTWPNGLTIDYPAQRIYWVDAFRDMIEYSNVDGSGRFLLLSNLDHPFSITLEGNLLFWTDWLTNAIHATHKISSTGASFVYNNLRDRPFGIEAVTPTRQAQNITNPCDGTSCTFMCLLSSTDPNGYSCACPDGYELSSDNTDCTFVGTLPPPTAVGSCVDAGYQNCCIAGYCAGSPPTCSCDLTCYLRGDCCPDANMTCPRGSCAAAGYRACCTDGGTCRGSAGCFCDYACTFFGDCCYDFEDLCPTDVGTVVGSCSAAGYTTCCDDGSECLGTPANCKCDAECRDHGDCCADIGSTCPLLPSGNFTIQMTWLPFLTLRSTPGVVTNSVPRVDDGSSPAIPIPTGFPIGNTNQSVAYIGTNGVVSFQQPFTYHIPSLFPSSLSFVSSAYLLAPFWSDVDITIYGSIFYEVHSDSDSLLIQQVNNFISNQTETDFRGTWMLVVQWDEVREFPGFLTIPTNTYQAMAITDGSQSYAVYTYRCGDLQWPGGATIGYNGGPVGNFYQNHPLSGDFANSIACINTGVTEWSNVIYNVSIAFTGQPPTNESGLPYVSLGTTDGVEREYVGHFDDGVSHAIHIPNGFPFGNFIHSSVYVGTNGIFSFSEPFYSAVAVAFPSTLSSVANAYLVAPYWDDVDIRLAGNISYEVHSRSNNNLGSNQLLDQISQFVEDSTGDSFQGDWMLVAEWEEVHPWPHGLDNPIFQIFFPELVLNNTWQGLVITDGVTSYAVFTYRCGDMNWAYGPTIGFNAAGDNYVNHPNTGSTNGEEIACLNSPTSQWYNLVYEISLPNATDLTAQLPTVEPPQSRYLSFLEFTNNTATSGTLPPCQNCTIPITIPGNGFPFGSYYHSTVYIGTNGIFSFGRDFRQDTPEAFPSTDAEIYFAYLVAPYWSNIDTRLDGQVNYEVHVIGESATSNDYLGRVSSLINSEQDPDFTGNWMIVVTWDGVHPFPHGNSAEQDRVDPYLQSVNTFQGILITNGTKSYSVFTYECDQMEWSDEATIGYNAGGEYNASHPLSGTLFANAIDCLHININETINNIIYNLVPGELNVGTTPPPPSSLGSCIAAGYSDCCEDGICFGHFSDCFCDEFCYNFDDCCSDVTDICSIEAPLGNDTYLVFGSVQLLSRVGLNGSDLHVLVHQPNTAVLGVDFDYRRGYLYWSEGIGDVMYRSNMDGSNIEALLNTSIDVVDDIAMDWIGNNLYWTDAVHARIEVMDMDTSYRMELMRTGANTIPRAIAVDPSTRFMYWTDWGDEARIERASMDGSDRRVLHNTGLTWPNGLTIDYPAQRIYWVDAFRDMIEYSNVDGSGRFLLLSNLDHPFSITLEGNLLFWTDWLTNAIHATHKISSTGASFVYNNLRDRPFGIEAVTPTRQAQNITNPCDGTSCTFMCLLSSTDPNGYSCACPDGYELSSDNTDCTFVGTLPPPTAVGSCVDAGYQNCCIAGYCAGSPPTCSCDLTCYLRGDCCPDANMTCPRGSCAAAGYRACCTDGGTCRGSAGCFCDYACTFFGDCCYDFEDLCPTDVGTVVGSCSAAGYTTCCDDGSECLGTPANCKCDAECRDHGDCCADIGSTCPLLPSGNFTIQMTWLPFLTLRSTPGVVTNSVPRVDDGSSPAIPIPTGFPIGNTNQSVAYIGTNGVVSFQQPFTYHIPSLFPSSLSFVSSAYLLAPFWSDVDITIYGSIFYEVHSDSDSLLIQQVNNFISNQTETDFRGTWMLVVQWDEVREFPGFLTIPTNTYQAMAITDGSQSYAVYTYRCGDLQWPGGATIGYNGGPVGNFYQNHPLSGDFANSIACINTGVTEWSNVIYNVSIAFTGQPPTNESGLPYVSLGTTDGVEREYVGHFDDGVSHAIHIPNGFPFGNFIHSSVYVGTNGIFSFSEPFYSAVAVAFPSTLSSVANAYLVAPYWDDVDIRLAGNISYEVHSRSNNNLGSNQLLDQISQFVEDSTGDSFQGDWMLVAEWEEVHPWPHGLDNPIFQIFFPELVLNNTWQGLVITDGVTSYAVFTYRCGDMNWAYGPTIGFNAAGDNYVNHPNTGSTNGEEIACLNSPTSQWYNLVYEISLPNATDLTAQLPTVEPPQSRYLSFLEFTNNTATSGTLPPCQNCTVPITIPRNGFPFGSYYHSTVYIGTNGIFSFGRDFRQDTPEAFPSTDAEIYFAYLVAPYWSNIDTRLDGQVNYEVHVMGESATSNDYLGRVSSFINSELDPDFTGNWMIVVTWDGVHPFPHGNSAEQDRVDPYLQSVNTFQGILITNGTKSYSVFTYECDQMEWSDEATIGYNAGGEYNASHPLSGTLFANAIDCLHININETVNNIIYDLVPGELNVGTTPPPPSSLGSCVAAGYSDCCEDGVCFGHISDCFCDEFCYNFDDCCSDVSDICSIEAPLGNDTYLVFGSVQLLSRVGLNGSDLHVLVHQPNTAVLGVDFDYRRGYLYWSEGIGDVMYRSTMDGSNIEALLNTSIEVVDDIAMDWIGNNLYWTDAVHARIEVMDMDSRYRMELMRTGANTIPRAIAVDPSTRFMYWTDWGDEARIERASMDGSDRRILHNTDLTWPNGLTIDYPAQRIYWVDAFRDMIEYSNVDGSGRFLLLSNLDHPFSITLEGNLLFWSDWFTNAIHATHKISSTGATFVYNNLRDRPFGIEAVTPNRQAQNITNPCDGTSCTFMCLLSSADPNGYSCACPDGYELSSDNTDCTFVGTLPPPTAIGSCVDAGYQNCCIAGYCAGSPPTCSCDLTCYLRGDCCPDANMTCPRGSCAAAGYRACCTDGGTCRGSAGCFCDYACTFFGDCCYDFEDLCPTDVGTVVGSCSAAGYTTCCDDGSECLGTPANCKCDAECRDHGDCCADIGSACPLTPPGNFTIQMTWLPFLTLRSTPGVVTNSVPRVDDGSSPAISIPTGFPIGNSNQSTAYIGTNGVISFQQPFTYHIPSLFPSSLSFVSSAYLLAPFWSDVDITIYGNIFYEVHNNSDSLLIQQVNNFISNQTETDFSGTWMLVVQWDEVREFPGFLTIPTNTYQAMAITDGSQSYVVYTYRCGDLQWPGGATIGYNGGPVGNFYQNHPLSGDFANSIACINTGVTEWSNVIYNVSIDMYFPTGQPTTTETVTVTSSPFTSQQPATTQSPTSQPMTALPTTTTQATAQTTMPPTSGPTTAQATAQTTMPPTSGPTMAQLQTTRATQTTQSTEATTTPQLGAPGSVVGLSAVVPDGSVTILTVIWSAPAQPSGAVSQYYVIVTNYSLASVTNKNVSGDTTSTNVTDLSPFIPYNVTVIASNAIGNSAAVSILSFTQEGVPPVPPSNIKVELDSNTKLIVTWDLLNPEEAWGFVTSYTVSYKKATDSDNGKEMSVSGTDNSLQIGDLDPNQDYIIVMWANTTAGMGQRSKAISTKTSSGTIVGGANISGGGIAGILIGIVVGLVVLVSVVLIAAWMFRKYKKKTVAGYDFFSDSASMTSETSSGDFRARLDSYQTKFGKKKKEAEGKVKPTSYKPVGGITSFENPLYESNPRPEVFALPGVASYADDSSTYVDVSEEKVDMSEVKL